MKIDFKKPKYLIPLFLLPFIFLFYYLYGRPNSNNKEVKSKINKEQKGLQATMPSVDKTISDKQVENKFSTFKKAYRHATDSSAIRAIISQEKAADKYSYNPGYSSSDIAKAQNELKMDSLNKTLAEGQARMQEALSTFHKQMNGSSSGASNSLDKRNSISNREIIESLNRSNKPDELINSDTLGDSSMKDFKQRMLFMDSLRKAAISNAGKKNTGSNKSGYHPYRKFDPDADTSFNPLPVSTSRTSSLQVFNTVTNLQDDENAITAMIDQNTKVVLGSRVRIRLLKSIFVGAYKIEKGAYLYGMVTGFQTQRVNISISQIQYHNKSLPVKIDVFDNDGYLGLYVPGSNFREFSKEIGTQSTRGMSQVITPDGSNVKMNLLSQVFNTTTTTMAALIKKDKAYLKYDYIVYLKEDKTDSRN